MIAELGHLALVIAACLAIAQAAFSLAGAQTGRQAWIAVARPVAIAHCLFLFLAFIALAHCFAVLDFSVVYVARNASTRLPLAYRIAATWGAHEGSLLLWVTVLGLWTALVARASRALPEEFVARVLGVLGLVALGFEAFVLLTSNPFLRILPAPPDGQELNPLLQDIGLVVHPPILYTGYVGFAVAFGFAVATLLGGKFESAWARWARPWTIVAWLFLTVGIALGSWWAYYELGWGGWWFWDPVENASFLPWLAGTALLHSLAVSDQRGVFRSWTLLLSVTAFALSLLGTFLVRSGVLTSVHAFAADPARGVFVLALLAIVVGGSLALYAWRAPRLADVRAGFAPLSRESALLGNNLLLIVGMASVLLGTVYPLMIDALGLGKISVGAPYFNAVFVPVALLVGALLPLGVMTHWKKDQAPRLRRKLAWTGAVATIGGLAVGAALPPSEGRLTSGLAVAVALWIVAGTARGLMDRRQGDARWFSGWRTISRAQWGMALAHAGLAITIVGIAVSSQASREVHRRMAPGQSVEVAGYRFSFESVGEVQGPNYRAVEAAIEVSRDGVTVARLHPQKRAYGVRGMPMTEAGIDPGFTRDLYASLGEMLDDENWSARFYVKPFVRWIWLGALAMALGGLVAATDRRYRLQRQARAESGESVPANWSREPQGAST
ncbi:MAG: heme lyase CcmF/NrfE family subunit [Betaproteobacteria bacterium]|nr:heme lyase CcmF/NrfE family subunit [Betaproteobacteria bacterium]